MGTICSHYHGCPSMLNMHLSLTVTIKIDKNKTDDKKWMNYQPWKIKIDKHLGNMTEESISPKEEKQGISQDEESKILAWLESFEVQDWELILFDSVGFELHRGRGTSLVCVLVIDYH